MRVIKWTSNEYNTRLHSLIQSHNTLTTCLYGTQQLSTIVIIITNAYLLFQTLSLLANEIGDLLVLLTHIILARETRRIKD
jgi:hypothetical protein